MEMEEPKGALGATLLAVLVAVLVAVPGCSDSSGRAGSTASGSSGPTTTATVSGAVTVMAPAPLKAALDRVKAAFEAEHAGTTVDLNYGHVPALVTQISEGFPADVLVSPDEATMRQAHAKGVVGPSTTAVARNKLVLLVPLANPAKVKDVKALGDAGLTLVVCASELPCGELTGQVAAKAGVRPLADSQEPGGSLAVVTKVASGEADLGVAYLTDTRAAGDKVTTLPFDDALGASATVTAAAVSSPAHARAAEEFLAFLSSAEGRAAFAGAGFSAL
jgi:molybdate transport system substrate-binding protein